KALIDVVQIPSIDIVLSALMGFAGLEPTLAAIQARKTIALANKETLVVAGELITNAAKKYGVDILPVDSEHSAIYQCLVGEKDLEIEKIILTASGGPFFGRDLKFLSNVTAKDALKHPNWEMGQKITIDSASLMNKGLEAIEAHWLFDIAACQIDVVVHPQSIIHSMVQFHDGSIKAQIGLPDMKLPIQYALTYPYRQPNSLERFDFMNYASLTFEEADRDTFRNLELAYQSLRDGGDRPCVLNAANEVAVAAFLADEISFLGMSDLIEATMCQQKKIETPSFEDLLAIDAETRIVARSLVK